MDIRIYNNLSGAKEAKGITVIIDVFRAFTVECFLINEGVKKIIPVGDKEICLKLKKEHPDYFLVGERKGVKLEGFDCGNSPSQLTTLYDLRGKTIVHSTSAGTQGLKEAKDATEVLTGSFVNAKAISRYILSKNPKEVSLVAMGLNGIEESAEDTLCANYIKSLLEGKDIDITDKLNELKNTSGKKFFDKVDGVSFPEPDFFMCITQNIFDFVLRFKYNTKSNMHEIEVVSNI